MRAKSACFFKMKEAVELGNQQTTGPKPADHLELVSDVKLQIKPQIQSLLDHIRDQEPNGPAVSVRGRHIGTNW